MCEPTVLSSLAPAEAHSFVVPVSVLRISAISGVQPSQLSGREMAGAAWSSTQQIDGFTFRVGKHGLMAQIFEMTFAVSDCVGACGLEKANTGS